MKTYFPTLLANERQKNRLGERILEGSLAHAYLLQGPRGCGKRYFAHLLAAALCCEKKESEDEPLPCGACRSCRRILADATPDLVTVSRGENATIGVDAVRRMKSEAYLSPVENEKKVYIVEEAACMTAAAQNALLILLEEPPPDVVIFLLTEESSALLPTVQSRVQTLRMSLFTREQMLSFLEGNEAAARLRREDPALLDTILTASDGSPGKALALLDRSARADLQKTRERVMAILDCLCSRAPFSLLSKAVGRLPTKRQDCMEELSLLSLALRDMILLKRDGQVCLSFFSDREDAMRRAEALPLRRLFRMSDLVQRATREMGRNANINLTLTTLTDSLHTLQ